MAYKAEHREQVVFIQWMKLTHKDILVAAIPNGGSRNKFEAVGLKREGVLAGMPDIFIARASGDYHGLFIEMKAPASYRRKAGVATAVQLERIAKLKAEGYQALVCHGFIDAKAAVEGYLHVPAVCETSKKTFTAADRFKVGICNVSDPRIKEMMDSGMIDGVSYR